MECLHQDQGEGSVAFERWGPEECGDRLCVKFLWCIQLIRGRPAQGYLLSRPHFHPARSITPSRFCSLARARALSLSRSLARALFLSRSLARALFLSRSFSLSLSLSILSC
jgi:hypothetical protein